MKGKTEQPTRVSLLLAILFLTGAVLIFQITKAASNSGIVKMITGNQGLTTFYRTNAPELFWVCFSIYAMAGLGCVGGFLRQVGKAFRNLRASA